MKAWIFLLLLIIVVLKLCSKKSDYAPGIDPDGSNFAVYLGLGYDVSTLGGVAVYWTSTNNGTYHKLAVSTMWTKSREEVNYTIWTASTLSLNDGTTISNPSTTVWGFHKELQAGGGGKLFYLVNLTGTSDATTSIQAGSAGSTMTPAPTLTEYTDCISNILYEIPQYVICQTSAVTSVLTCSTNAILTTPQGPDGTGGVCTCNAGYYGNGITCQLCPVGSYCTGGATATNCPSDSARGGANIQTTVGQGSTIVNACYNSCSAQAVLSGGSTTTAGSCLCPVGYASSTSAGLAANGAICTPCPAGTAQTSSPVVNVTSCPSCSPGYYTSTSGNTSCTQCPAGSSTNAGTTSCTSCTTGYYSTGPSSTCSPCPPGSSSYTPFTSCIVNVNATITDSSVGYSGGNNSSILVTGIFPTSNVIAGIFMWVAPGSRTYTFQLTGGGGAGPPNNGTCYAGQSGQTFTASVYLTQGTLVYMVIGHGATAQGTTYTTPCAVSGGGGTFVFIMMSGTLNNPSALDVTSTGSSTVYTVLCAAGGRGGGGYLANNSVTSTIVYPGASTINYSGNSTVGFCKGTSGGLAINTSAGGGLFGFSKPTPLTGSAIFQGGNSTVSVGGFGGGGSIYYSSANLIYGAGAGGLMGGPGGSSINAVSGVFYPTTTPASGTVGYVSNYSTVGFVSSGPGNGGAVSASSKTGTSGSNGQIIIS